MQDLNKEISIINQKLLQQKSQLKGQTEFIGQYTAKIKEICAAEFNNLGLKVGHLDKVALQRFYQELAIDLAQDKKYPNKAKLQNNRADYNLFKELKGLRNKVLQDCSNFFKELGPEFSEQEKEFKAEFIKFYREIKKTKIDYLNYLIKEEFLPKEKLTFNLKNPAPNFSNIFGNKVALTRPLYEFMEDFNQKKNKDFQISRLALGTGMGKSYIIEQIKKYAKRNQDPKERNIAVLNFDLETDLTSAKQQVADKLAYLKKGDNLVIFLDEAPDMDSAVKDFLDNPLDEEATEITDLRSILKERGIKYHMVRSSATDNIGRLNYISNNPKKTGQKYEQEIANYARRQDGYRHLEDIYTKQKFKYLANPLPNNSTALSEMISSNIAETFSYDSNRRRKITYVLPDLLGEVSEKFFNENLGRIARDLSPVIAQPFYIITPQLFSDNLGKFQALRVSADGTIRQCSFAEAKQDNFPIISFFDHNNAIGGGYKESNREVTDYIYHPFSTLHSNDNLIQYKGRIRDLDFQDKKLYYGESDKIRYYFAYPQNTREFFGNQQRQDFIDYADYRLRYRELRSKFRGFYDALDIPPKQQKLLLKEIDEYIEYISTKLDNKILADPFALQELIQNSALYNELLAKQEQLVKTRFASDQQQQQKYLNKAESYLKEYFKNSLNIFQKLKYGTNTDYSLNELLSDTRHMIKSGFNERNQLNDDLYYSNRKQLSQPSQYRIVDRVELKRDNNKTPWWQNSLIYSGGAIACAAVAFSAAMFSAVPSILILPFALAGATTATLALGLFYLDSSHKKDLVNEQIDELIFGKPQHSMSASYPEPSTDHVISLKNTQEQNLNSILTP